jgi:hypothetical protein
VPAGFGCQIQTWSAQKAGIPKRFPSGEKKNCCPNSTGGSVCPAAFQAESKTIYSSAASLGCPLAFGA